MTPFFVQKGTELFEALLIGLRSKRNSRRFAIPEKRKSLFPHFLSSLAIQIAAAFLLATDDGAGAGRRGDGRAVANKGDTRFAAERRVWKLQMIEMRRNLQNFLGRSDTGGGKKWAYSDWYVLNSGLKRSHFLASESLDQLSDLNSVITTSFNLR